MFKDYLKNTRETHGMSMKDMAEKLNLSYRTYQNWETGLREPNSLTIEAIKTKIEMMEGKIMNSKKYGVCYWHGEDGDETEIFDTYEEAMKAAREYAAEESENYKTIIKYKLRYEVDELIYNADLDEWEPTGNGDVVYVLPRAIRIKVDDYTVAEITEDIPKPGMEDDYGRIIFVEHVEYTMCDYYESNSRFYSCLKVTYYDDHCEYLLIDKALTYKLYEDRAWNDLTDKERIILSQEIRVRMHDGKECTIDLAVEPLSIGGLFNHDIIAKVKPEARIYNNEEVTNDTVGRLLDSFEGIRNFDNIELWQKDGYSRGFESMVFLADRDYSGGYDLYDTIEIDSYYILTPEEYVKAQPVEEEAPERDTLIIVINKSKLTL